jgi:integrase/recombinase XerD
MEQKSIEQLLDEYLEYLRLIRRSSETIYKAKTTLARWLAYAQGPGDRDLALKWLDQWENPRTRSTQWAIVRGFVRWLSDEGYCEDWTRKIKIRARRVASRNVLTDAELDALLATCDASWLGRRDYAILTLLIYTGARNAEVRKLRVRDVDIEAREFRALIKGGDIETFHLTPHAARVLGDWMDRHVEGDYIFRGWRRHRDAPIDRSTLKDMINRRVRQAGLKRHVYPHMFRHTAAQKLLDAGYPLEVIQKVLHHKSIQSTQIYAKTAQQKAAKAMDAVFG